MKLIRRSVPTSVFLFSSLLSLGADSLVRSSPTVPPYKYWTKYKTCLRLGLGVQQSFFTELGIARHKYVYGEQASAASAYYTSLEWIPTLWPQKDRNIVGVKAGYEMNLTPFTVAVEAKYQTDFLKNDVVLTPKAGLGILGIINLLYGYNISLRDRPFSKVGRHQFSLVCNLNRSPVKN